MEQLNHKLQEILNYLSDPGKGSHAGDKKICYLTFPLEKTLEIKKHIENWVSLTKHHNYNTEVLSLGNVINSYFLDNPRRSNWLSFSQVDDSYEMNELYMGLSSMIVENMVLEEAILLKQEQLLKKQKPLLIITDLEGIHPFTRFGPVEQNIYNQIQIPLIILYPGKLSGSSLEFLGFYPPDGNYRSKHF